MNATARHSPTTDETTASTSPLALVPASLFALLVVSLISVPLPWRALSKVV
ncbi:MAG: hypothetical protein IPJ27_06395 [Candidatus Accumulibacter sp.]|uniref:Uncharacterized protein n=1 Tax=Candidatus Accumulibacter proximus TaxID=2954385 RepID=A0A935PY34_9PROT|nr:hypothetical protein [Candidatus Accumulibacter proximus]